MSVGYFGSVADSGRFSSYYYLSISNKDDIISYYLIHHLATPKKERLVTQLPLSPPDPSLQLSSVHKSVNKMLQNKHLFVQFDSFIVCK